MTQILYAAVHMICKCDPTSDRIQACRTDNMLYPDLHWCSWPLSTVMSRLPKTSWTHGQHTNRFSSSSSSRSMWCAAQVCQRPTVFQLCTAMLARMMLAPASTSVQRVPLSHPLQQEAFTPYVPLMSTPYVLGLNSPYLKGYLLIRGIQYVL